MQIRKYRTEGVICMAEMILWIFFLAGWLAMLFAAGCLLEELSKKLRAVPKRHAAKQKKPS